MVRGNRGVASNNRGWIEDENEQTYLYIQFDVTRLGEPLSHSGTKVMNPKKVDDQYDSLTIKSPNTTLTKTTRTSKQRW